MGAMQRVAMLQRAENDRGAAVDRWSGSLPADLKFKVSNNDTKEQPQKDQGMKANLQMNMGCP